MYSITAFARLTGVTIKALRHYERVDRLDRVIKSLKHIEDNAMEGVNTFIREAAWDRVEILRHQRADTATRPRDHVASLYEATPEAWERVAAFIERGE